MIIKRDKYLNELIVRKNNGLIKVITGLRRSGKSYLLNTLFKDYLLKENVSTTQIISFSFDNMENIIYNELIIRGYSVDVDVVEINEISNNNYVTKQLETDFVCNKINERIYIQSAYSMESIDKLIQEKKPLINIKDFFKKIIIVKDSIKPYLTEDGIEVISLKDWLLN